MTGPVGCHGKISSTTVTYEDDLPCLPWPHGVWIGIEQCPAECYSGFAGLSLGGFQFQRSLSENKD